jgi:enoyl-CoA hydratase
MRLALNAYADFERLVFDRPSPKVLRITLATPAKLNVMDARSHAELAAVWRIVDRDDSVGAVIVRGSPQAFSAGGDLSRQKEVIADHTAQLAVMDETRELVYGIINCSKPVVSAIRGWAVGAGLACALLADISIAAKDAKLTDGHVKIGLAAGDHAALIWPLLCGLAKAKYYMLLGERLDGAEAERIGLVSLALDDAEVDGRAEEIAQRLAEGSRTAIRWTKYAMNNWLRQAGPLFDASLALEIVGFGGRDATEGVDAFMEKRAANFD